MKRTYLEEDLGLIQKYFPGAKSVALRTPFDLTRPGQRMPGLDPESFHDTDSSGNWTGDIAWTN